MRRTAPSAAMVVVGMFSIQSAAAIATGLFDRIGPSGAMLLRFTVGGIALLALVGFRLPAIPRGRRLEVFLFGANLAASNLVFFLAIRHLSLGVVTTIEFIGPMTVAVLGHRARIDLVWVFLAATGVVLLSLQTTGEGGSLGGIALALLAGTLWGIYILQNARVGAMFEGLGALSFAMLIGAVVLIPAGVVEGGTELLQPSILLLGIPIGILGSAVPYALEFEALRRIPNGLFAVLMSLEPAVAAVVGFLALSQGLGPLDLLAIALVIVASVGALTATGAQPPRDR